MIFFPVGRGADNGNCFQRTTTRRTYGSNASVGNQELQMQSQVQYYSFNSNRFCLLTVVICYYTWWSVYARGSLQLGSGKVLQCLTNEMHMKYTNCTIQGVQSFFKLKVLNFTVLHSSYFFKCYIFQIQAPK